MRLVCQQFSSRHSYVKSLPCFDCGVIRLAIYAYLHSIAFFCLTVNFTVYCRFIYRQLGGIRTVFAAYRTHTFTLQRYLKTRHIAFTGFASNRDKILCQLHIIDNITCVTHHTTGIIFRIIKAVSKVLTIRCTQISSRHISGKRIIAPICTVAQTRLIAFTV